MPHLSPYANPETLAQPTYDKLEILGDYSMYTLELLGKPPAWILRWGGTVILTLIMAIILLSWIVKYPDIVSAKVTVTTPIPPASLVARQSGKLHWLKSNNHQQVKKNDLLAVIESSANFNDIVQLKEWLKNYSPHQVDVAYLATLPQNLKLGDIQNQFAQFQKQLNEMLFFLTSNPLAKKIVLNRKKQQQLEAMLNKFQQQATILRSENTLLDKNLQRFQQLQTKQLISASNVDEKQISLLNNRRQQEQLSVEASRTQIELTNLSTELNELNQVDANKRESFKLNLAEAYQALLTSLSLWEKNYLLTSPIEGRLVLSKFWGEFQVVNVGEEVVTIVPFEKQPILAKMKMPLENSGKVKTGQKLLIKLAGYPYQEYGQIVSKINSISLVPRENMYTVDAILPNPLVTSYKKTLSFHQEMQGQAEIVTEDIRLLERVFYQLRKVLKKAE
ncbi:MAG: HlyD family efflux transporter periplasmic adaptor subunit [Methylococcaceae bacterium]|nr:HlyD family efflux transporter periplasmic adaptor subunit [Methylococcaceae bacterium]